MNRGLDNEARSNFDGVNLSISRWTLQYVCTLGICHSRHNSDECLLCKTPNSQGYLSSALSYINMGLEVSFNHYCNENFV
jgi:hypothetical protein